jgi:PAS domain S-box-containing protein
VNDKIRRRTINVTVTDEGFSDRPFGAAPRAATLLLRGTTIISASPAGLTLLGAERESDVVGRDVFDFVAPGWVPGDIDFGLEPATDLTTVIQVDGTQVLTQLDSTPVMAGGIPALCLSLYDLDLDAARLRRLVAGSGHDADDALFVTDNDFRIQGFDAAAEALYGWSEDEVMGRWMVDTVADPSAERHAPAVLAELARHGRWEGHCLQRARDGRGLWVRSSVSVLRDRGGRCVGTVWSNRLVSVCEPVTSAAG